VFLKIKIKKLKKAQKQLDYKNNPGVVDDLNYQINNLKATKEQMDIRYYYCFYFSIIINMDFFNRENKIIKNKIIKL
jgi:hypothetical protein